MKIYIDENVPLKIVTWIQAEGYVVEYVTRTTPDQDILANALKENCVVDYLR